MSSANIDCRDRIDLRPDAKGEPLNDRIRYMVRSGGYVMVRKPRSMPFVLTDKEWAKLPLFPSPPTNQEGQR